MRHWRLIALAGVVLAVIALRVSMPHVSLQIVQEYAHLLYAQVQQRYMWSVLVYMFSLFIATIAMIPVTVLLTLLGGFLFGIFWAACYVIGAVTLGSVCLVLLVRTGLFGAFAVENAYLQRFKYVLEQDGARYVFALQLLPFTPSPVLNIVVGLSDIRLWTFVWATALGILPSTFVYTWAGQQLHTLQSVQDAMPIVVVIILSALAGIIAAPAINRLLRVSQ